MRVPRCGGQERLDGDCLVLAAPGEPGPVEGRDERLLGRGLDEDADVLGHGEKYGAQVRACRHAARPVAGRARLR